MEADIQDVPYKHKHTEAEIAKIIEEANSEITARKQEATREKLKEKEVEFSEEQIEKAVALINLLPERGINLKLLLETCKVNQRDRKEFISKIVPRLRKAWRKEVRIFLEDKEIQIKDIENSTVEKILIKGTAKLVKKQNVESQNSSLFLLFICPDYL